MVKLVDEVSYAGVNRSDFNDRQMAAGIRRCDHVRANVDIVFMLLEQGHLPPTGPEIISIDHPPDCEVSTGQAIDVTHAAGQVRRIDLDRIRFRLSRPFTGVATSLPSR
jgi:hypothetical protein